MIVPLNGPTLMIFANLLILPGRLSEGPQTREGSGAQGLRVTFSAEGLAQVRRWQEKAGESRRQQETAGDSRRQQET